jgi:outer membrane immunogenic protein
MKRILLSGMALAAMAVGPAFGANMPLKAPMAPAPTFSWTGCYIGGHAGGAWARQDVNVNPAGLGAQAPSPFSLSSNNWIAGGQVGCNQQFGTVVVGGELDATSTRDLLNSTVTGPNLFPNGLPVGSGGISVTTSGQWLASARIRLGIAVVPNVLVYLTGGPAWQHTNYNVLDAFRNGCPNCDTLAFSNNNAGVAVGGGVEWSPMSNGILIRGEFLYYDLSSASQSMINFGSGVNGILFSQGDLKVAVARAGLSFKY